MFPKHYRIAVNKATLPLITFLNDGVEPVVEKSIRYPWFLFTLNSPTEITVPEDAIQNGPDLYDTGWRIKIEYYDHTVLTRS